MVFDDDEAGYITNEDEAKLTVYTSENIEDIKLALIRGLAVYKTREEHDDANEEI
jgi:hypothetical protein